MNASGDKSLIGSDKKARRECVLILGMHRSGTSALARCMNLCGMALGEHLLAPDSRNAKGYWEHAGVVRINDELLEDLGLKWYSARRLPDHWMHSEAAERARVKIIRLVEEGFADVALWGIKDPRMCRLAPLWMDVLRGLGIKVSAVLVTRPPSEVARSLALAQDVSQALGLMLWLIHLVEAEQASRGAPRSMVSYDEALSAPVDVLARIGRDLGLDWPAEPSSRSDELLAFLDRGLRHQRQRQDGASTPAYISDLAKAAEAARSSDERPGDWTRLERMSEDMRRWMELLELRHDACPPDESMLIEGGAHVDPTYAELFHASADEDFSQMHCEKKAVSVGRSSLQWRLPSSPAVRFRLAPSASAGYLRVYRLQVVDAQGVAALDWIAQPSAFHMHGMEKIGTDAQGGVLIQTGEDPQFHFTLPGREQGALHTVHLDMERVTLISHGDALRIAYAPESDDSKHMDALAERSGREEKIGASVDAERISRQVLIDGLAKMDSQFYFIRSEIESRLESLDSKVDDADAKVARLTPNLDDLESRLQRIETATSSTLDSVASEIDALASDVDIVRDEARAQQQVIDRLVRLNKDQQEMLEALSDRRLLARLRFALAKVSLHLLPANELRRLDSGLWKAEGSDPRFLCQAGSFPLPAGWYMVDLELEVVEGDAGKPSLYPDYAGGAPVPVEGLPMDFVTPSQRRHRGLVRFERRVRALRFDPSTEPCVLSVGRFKLRKISRFRIGLSVLRRLALEIRGQRSWFAVVATGTRALLRHGPRQAVIRAMRARQPEHPVPSQSYAQWLQQYEDSSPSLLRQAREQASRWRRRPLISILVPTYNTDEVWLRRCIDSVLAQAYEQWELCIADDASPEPRVMQVLHEYAAQDKRIRVMRRDENGHISKTTNSALGLASGQYVALLDHDDELHPMALFEVVRALREHPHWRLIYTDEDKIDPDGQRYDPYMKPDWNYELLLSQNCISHLGVYDRALVEQVGGFREGYEGSQDWDLALRCVEKLKPAEIGHIPKVLYHWRAIPGSTAVMVNEKSYARVAAERAIGEHLQRIHPGASVEEIEDRPGNFRVRFPLPDRPPKISLIIPTRDGLHLLKQCVESILDRTTYEHYEIVIVDNQSEQEETLRYLDQVVDNPRVRVVAYDHPFNYSALNNYAVAQTDGELVALINNDIEVISPDWLQEMASQAIRPDIGAVGAMLYYPDDTIQHAGVVLGVHGVAAHAYCGQPRGHAGQMGRARLSQELSAVTAACLLVRREVFDEVGGLDETLKVAFNDIDFCLRVRKAGYRNIWTPFAELYHHESATRGREDSPEKKARFMSEVEHMMTQWSAELEADPAYNVNLSIDGVPYSLAFPPRGRATHSTSSFQHG